MPEFKADLADLDPNRIPTHVGCVMDGNGRWASDRGLKRTDGHTAGELSLFDTVHGCIQSGVQWLTVYAFSTENWRRPPDEVKFLVDFNRDVLYRRRDELNDLDVRVRFIGRRGWRVPKRVINEMNESAELTRNNKTLTLTIAFNYGGRAEIVDAVKQLVEDGVPLSKINEAALAKRMYDPEMPDPELIIRSSGESRISNFLLWELAYSELVFTDTLWPDFRREHLWGSLLEYQQRQRRFGGV